MSLTNPFQAGPAHTSPPPPSRPATSGGAPRQKTSVPSWKSATQQLNHIATKLEALQIPEDVEPTDAEARAFRRALQVVQDDVGRLKRIMGIGKP